MIYTCGASTAFTTNDIDFFRGLFVPSTYREIKPLFVCDTLLTPFTPLTALTPFKLLIALNLAREFAPANIAISACGLDSSSAREAG